VHRSRCLNTNHNFRTKPGYTSPRKSIWLTVGVISLTNFRPRASTKTCSELCCTRHQFITGNRDGYFVSFVLVVAHKYMVHVVGAGITTPILSPLPETTTWHSVLDLVKLEKRVPGNHDSLSLSLVADKRAYNFRCNWCKTIFLLWSPKHDAREK
jgi:hypothetical protein